jgi:hypothetical protein
MAVDLLSIFCHGSEFIKCTEQTRAVECVEEARESDGESEIVSKNLKKKVVF